MRLADGRVGDVVRVDTLFPANLTTVTIWTPTSEHERANADGPAISKVSLSDVVGEAPRKSA